MLFVITYYNPRNNSTTAITRNLSNEDDAKLLFKTPDNSNLQARHLYKLDDDGQLTELSNKKKCLTCGAIVDRTADWCGDSYCDGYYGYTDID